LYGLRRGTVRLGLTSTRRLLRELGSPERDLPILHVGGTNGKGSTTAFAAAMLQAGGMRVGRFTSPHVLHVEERICVDGEPIAAGDLRARVRELWPLFERCKVSFFEAMTALAALHFRAARVDVAVYEVGLGGRLDSTNALPTTTSIVCSIGHDHEAILGRGLRAVCREKLGIVRRGVPFFGGFTRPDLVRMAHEHCARRRAPCTMLPESVGEVRALDASGMRFDLHVPEVVTLRSRLLGAHQVRNAALAVAGVRALEAQGLGPRRADLAAGAAQAMIPGRFQILPGSGGQPPVVLDAGHNPEALHTTLDTWERVFPGIRPVVVLGLMRDKRLDDAAPRLAAAARSLILTAPRVERAWDPARGRARFPSGRGFARLEVERQVEQAIARACDTTRDAPVLVLGSHYLLADAIPILAAARGVEPERLLRAGAPEPVSA
jgi:dihydrofolate synthase/folylpolyglutamate synthase